VEDVECGGVGVRGWGPGGVAAFRGLAERPLVGAPRQWVGVGGRGRIVLLRRSRVGESWRRPCLAGPTMPFSEPLWQRWHVVG
jgi:hypothetical protein